MCSHYQGLREPSHYQRYFGVTPPVDGAKLDLWPGYLGAFIRNHPIADPNEDALPVLEAQNGLFGLVPHWANDTRISHSTYNCRSETAAEKPSFRDAWQRNQRCIIPADSIYEPDWRSGKAVATRIEHVSGEPLGIAGLWSRWKTAKGDWLYSYTMLTINAQTHALMNQFHKPADEKRMVVILPKAIYQRWLTGDNDLRDFLQPLDALQLRVAAPESVMGSLL